MSTLAVLGLGGAGQGQSAQAEARRLAASIQLASDEAMVTDRSLAINWDGEGYSFLQRDPGSGKWKPHDAADFGERYDLPAEMSLSADRPDLPLSIGEGSASGPVAFTVTAGGQRWQVRYDGLNAQAAPVAGG
jgi:general secretion pathway protein H